MKFIVYDKLKKIKSVKFRHKNFAEAHQSSKL